MIDIIISVISSSTISSVITFFLTKRKYNSEVTASEIKNMQEALSFYQDLSTDNCKRLETLLEANSKLEQEILNLKQEISRLTSLVCVTTECSKRKNF